MGSIKLKARLASLLYVLMFLVGWPGLLFVPGKLVVDGNAALTADRIRAAETLFRVGLASELAYNLVFLFVALALYRLFEEVNRGLAAQMVMLVACSIPILFLGVVSELGALILIHGASFLSPFSKSQSDSLAYLFLQLHGKGIGVVEVLWGLWLWPLGLLVMRSGFLPKFLGGLLLVAVPGNLLRVVATLFPSLHASLTPLANILVLGELPVFLWLLVWGFLPDRTGR
jgi:hypothetical protein